MFRSSALGMLVAACCTAACGTSTPVSPTTQTLEISPYSLSLAVAERVQFSASLVGPNGERTTVPAQWSADPPERLVFSGDNGTARARGTVVVIATYESYRAERSIDIVPLVAGTWSGTIRLNRCQKLSGPGPDVCRVITTAQHPITVRLTQSGNSIQGDLSVFRNPQTGTVTAQISVRGTVTGKATVGQGPSAIQVDLDGIRLDDATGGFVGLLNTERNVSTSFGLQRVREFYDLSLSVR